ncbi:hypothetical protein X962_5496 [Burkholderia pseudomallei MSHR7343]|nr:hypothetical protein X962_5496 [Burkholderia pseudomallei MSHR7343]
MAIKRRRSNGRRRDDRADIARRRHTVRSQPSQCASGAACPHAACASHSAPAHAAATTIRSQCPLFHQFSEWRFHSHGTPSGFGQSAIRCTRPPHAKPKSGAAQGWRWPSDRYANASSAAHPTPQCVMVRCVTQSRRVRRHHAISSQSGAVPPATPAANAARL